MTPLVHSPKPSDSMNRGQNELEREALLREQASSSTSTTFGVQLLASLAQQSEKVDAMSGKLDRLVGVLEEVVVHMRAAAPASAAPAPAPAPAKAPAQPTLVDSLEQERELEQVAVQDLADVHNGNVASKYPAIEAAACEAAAAGVGVMASSVPSGGGKHIADMNAAPLLELFVRGKSGGQGATGSLALGLSNELIVVPGPVSFSSKGSMLSVEKLRAAVPNAFVFETTAMHRRNALVAAGYLGGEELQKHDSIYMPQMKALAQQFLGGHVELPAAAIPECWGRFLSFERDAMFAIYEQRLSFGDTYAHITGPLLIEALADRAAALALLSAKPPVSAKGASGKALRGPAAGASGAGKFEPAKYLATEVPEQFRANCCLQFWRFGHCNREQCKFSAGHRCLRCNSTAHGGASCPSA
jgi:hypothetical protein